MSKRANSGFTIVELLIVIVVIGILAAITIVAYNGIQQRARDTHRRSDVAAIGKALQMWSATNGKSPMKLGGGAGAGSAYGWFEYGYSAGSTKSALLAANLVTSGVHEPQFISARRDYCTWYASDQKQWAVFTELENPSAADSATVSDLAAQSLWAGAVSGCTVGMTYTPNYVQTFSMPN